MRCPSTTAYFPVARTRGVRGGAGLVAGGAAMEAGGTEVKLAQTREEIARLQLELLEARRAELLGLKVSVLLKMAAGLE